MIDEILEMIHEPVFPDRTFEVTEFGAVGDGETDCTKAFEAAVRACNEAGGGRVNVPKGRYLTGPIHLLSNVDLHVERDATLLFKTEPKAYLPPVRVSWEGIEAMNYSPLVYACDRENVAITGEGTLDGRASEKNWWPWKGKKEFGWIEGQPNQEIGRIKLEAMAFEGLPVEKRTIGEKGYLRPNFVEFFKCRNILIRGVTVIRSPMWEVSLVLCENATVREVDINSHGPNNDGIDICSSKYVLIESTSFDTGDDCIVLKSGRNDDGRRVNVPTENVIVRNVSMKDGHGAVTLGSELSAGIRNVFVENCTMDSSSLWNVLRIKSNTMRGGTIENIRMRNIKTGQINDAFLSIDFYYESAAGPYIPSVRNVHLSNITSRKSRYALYVNSADLSPIGDLTVENSSFDGVNEGNFINGRFENLVLKNVSMNGRPLKNL